MIFSPTHSLCHREPCVYSNIPAAAGLALLLPCWRLSSSKIGLNTAWFSKSKMALNGNGNASNSNVLNVDGINLTRGESVIMGLKRQLQDYRDESDSDDDDDLIQELTLIDLTAEEPETLEIDPVAEKAVESSEEQVKASREQVKATKEPIKASQERAKACLIPVKACVKQVKVPEKPIKAHEKPVKAPDKPVKFIEKVNEANAAPKKSEHDNTRDFKCRSCDFAASTKRTLFHHRASVHKEDKQDGGQPEQDRKERENTTGNVRNVVDSKLHNETTNPSPNPPKRPKKVVLGSSPKVDDKKDEFKADKDQTKVFPQQEPWDVSLREGIVSVDQDQSDATSGKFKCPQCDYSVLSKRNLDRHLKRVHSDKLEIPVKKQGNKPQAFNCEKCPFVAGERADLEEHTASQHGTAAAKGDYSCEQCPYGTGDQIALRLHVIQEHNSVKISFKKQSNEQETRNLEKNPDKAVESKPAPELVSKSRPHKCSHCSYCALSPSKLLRHMQAVHDSGKVGNFKCTKCDYSSGTKQHLSRHMKYVHSAFHKSPNGTKEETTNQKSLSTQGSLKCPHCSYSTLRKSMLSRHIEGMHNCEELKDIRCTKCDFKCSRKTNLAIHIKTCHMPTVSDMSSTKTPDVLQVEGIKSESSGKKFPCSECDYIAATQQMITRHVTSVHENIRNFKCTECSSSFTMKFNLKAHMLKFHPKLIKPKIKPNEPMKQKRQRAPGSHKCSTCSYSTVGPAKLLRHIKLVHDNDQTKDIKCQKCDYECSRKLHLSLHMKYAHTEMPKSPVVTNEEPLPKEPIEQKCKQAAPGPHKCSYCAFSTITQSKLLKHTQAVHDSDKPKNFKCTKCNYACGTGMHLGQHYKFVHSESQESPMTTNEEIKPQEPTKQKRQSAPGSHKCTQCFYSTKDKTKLSRHIKGVHNSDRPKNFKCSKCDYKSSTHVHLGQHIKCVHSPMVTNEETIQKEQTKKRRLSAPGSHKCSHCSYSTVGPNKLLKHVKAVHDSDKLRNFKCTKCDNKYSTAMHLGQHMKYEHSESQTGPMPTNQVIKPQELSKHKRQSAPGSHKCPQCAYSTKGKTKLSRHIECVHNSDKPKNLKCSKCDYKCSAKVHLANHMKYVHSESQKSPLVTEKEVEAKKSSDYYLCAQCDFFTSEPPKLESHVEEVHEKVEKESNVAEEKQHSCSMCEFKSVFKHNVTRHIKLKHGQQSKSLVDILPPPPALEDENPPEVQKPLEVKIKLENISKDTKFKQFKPMVSKSHKCSFCPFSAPSPSKLSRHVQAVHEKLKGFHCPKCSYGSDIKIHLTAHMNKHHGGPQDDAGPLSQSQSPASPSPSPSALSKGLLKCQKCPFATKLQSSLKRHVRSVHDNKLKKVFKLGSKYQCSACPYITDRPSRLKTHVKAVHDEARDFGCPKCEFTTTTKYHLDSHVKSCSLGNKSPVVEGGKLKNPYFKIKVEKDSDDPKSLKITPNDPKITPNDPKSKRKKLKVKIKVEKNPEEAKPGPRSGLKQCPFTKKRTSNKKVALNNQCSFAANTAEELAKHMKIHIKHENAN